MSEASSWTAVILAGGRGTRMGGQDKPQLVLGDKSLLATLIDVLPAEVPVVVVGPVQPTPRAVAFCREDPPFSGPVAALAAALPFVHTATIGLLGGDMPHAGRLLVRLVAQRAGGAAAVPVDGEGRRQPLCSVLPSEAVRSAIGDLGEPAGASLQALLDRLEVDELVLSESDALLLRDIDVAADLDELGQ